MDFKLSIVHRASTTNPITMIDRSIFFPNRTRTGFIGLQLEWKSSSVNRIYDIFNCGFPYQLIIYNAVRWSLIQLDCVAFKNALK